MSDVLDAARNKEWDKVQVRRPLEAFRTSSVAHRAPNGYDTFLVSPESAQNRAVASTAHSRRASPHAPIIVLHAELGARVRTQPRLPRQVRSHASVSHFPDFSRRRSLATPLSSQNFGGSA